MRLSSLWRVGEGLAFSPARLSSVIEENHSPVTESEAVTQGVRVQVRARYSEPHSDPNQGHWFFLYTIRIANESSESVQLTDRHWYIVDGSGHTEEVQGPGVVGEQPLLEPGAAFEYTSGCPLTTPFGSMSGSYRMQREDGTAFEAEVGLFELSQPVAIH